jgi:endonuclease YncB( thermonuclease family)
MYGVLTLVLIIPKLSLAWSCKVIGVADGDTITVLRDKEQVRIRLYGIDCPERYQAFSKKAKQFTSEMVFGKVVEVEPVDVDRYGRTVALVTVFQRLVNEELVNGLCMGLHSLLHAAYLREVEGAGARG